jgi:hypothetical protein
MLNPESFPVIKNKGGRPKKLPIMGRPTSYRPEYAQQLLDHFNNSYKPQECSADKRLMWANFPTFEGFAIKTLGISWATFERWKDKYPEFNSVCIDAAKLQKDLLVKYTNAGIYNAQFAKFIAINMTDMRDESTLNLSGNITVQMGIVRDVEPSEMVDPLVKALDITPKSKAIPKSKQQALMLKLKGKKGKVKGKK